MRAAFAVLTAALLLSGCTWMQRQVPWTAPPPAPTQPAPRPEPVRPTPRPKPHAEHQAPVQQTPSQPQATRPMPAPSPPLDYSARCHAMAANRADDARQLGASAADQAKVRSDTYKYCMAQSVN